MKRPAFAVVDPDMRVLGEVRLKAPNDMLRAQLAKAPTARGRWLAAQALARSDDPVTIAALTATLGDDGQFWGTRAEAATALGAIRAKECFEALSKATGVAHPKVRRAVAEALGQFKTAASVEALKPLAHGDKSYLVEAEAARSLGKTRQLAAFDALLPLLDRPSWYDVVRAGAIDGLAALRDDRSTPHLLSCTRYGRPPRARRAAILALPKLVSDRKGREALEELLDDTDVLVRIDAARALGELADTKSRPVLRERLEVDLDARVRRRIRETMRDLSGDTKKTVESVRDDLEKLQSEHAELKTRLARVEARLEGKKHNHSAYAPVPTDNGKGQRSLDRAGRKVTKRRGSRSIPPKRTRGRRAT